MSGIWVTVIFHSLLNTCNLYCA